MTPARPIAPHGLDAYLRHAVVAGATQNFVEVLVLPRDEAEEKRRTMDVQTARALHEDRPRLVLLGKEPGVMRSMAHGKAQRTPLTICESGLVLPGDPPPIPWELAERESYPFCFLVGLSIAVRHFRSWGEWATGEGVDIVRLHCHVYDVPLPPASGWYTQPHTEQDLQSAGLLPWSGPPDPEDWPGEHRLWLFPEAWRTAIPKGLPTITHTGRRARYDPEDPGSVFKGRLLTGLLATTPGET